MTPVQRAEVADLAAASVGQCVVLAAVAALALFVSARAVSREYRDETRYWLGPSLWRDVTGTDPLTPVNQRPNRR